jgi:hypothetical protein
MLFMTRCYIVKSMSESPRIIITTVHPADTKAMSIMLMMTWPMNPDDINDIMTQESVVTAG